MKIVISTLLALLIFGCVSNQAPDGYEVVTSWLNKKEKLLLVDGSNLAPNVKKVFTSLLHSAEKPSDISVPLKVVEIDSYGEELEIWTLLRNDGNQTIYYLEYRNGSFTLKNPKEQDPKRGYVLKMAVNVKT
ncbi:hypothetical protein Q4567_16545 [Aliiglaciecola sp. 2_MG-2023]|uniref:hypothetical protein n=1 Tax=unclassified Aliiglaciecola TaxID=2593648 RepID=UPI0026E1699F|nr:MULTISPECIES: hypothetical protein [unclassified Aliiglaciecola]MDO6712346.1 hypothetical protein [Aliiglaciecola sp. 2_MG-2023]MDO6753248.1 hypothetical protein [Aliiglaciecola sp. 1_MG-2023]